MPASRKRSRAVAEEENSSKQTSATANGKGMKAFIGVSKSHVEDEGIKKRKTASQHEVKRLATKSAPAKTDCKRKRSFDSNTEEGDTEASVPEPNGRSGIFAPFRRKDESLGPSKRAKHAMLPPSPKETPSKRATAMFDRLKLDGPSQPIPFALSKKAQAALDTPPPTPEAEELDKELTLPIELQEIARLHASFLTALSLYYTHHGTSSPVGLSTILPQITKTWRKRTVTLEDVRRILALAPRPSEFCLEDYGQAGICLARSQPGQGGRKGTTSYIDEDRFNYLFESALQEKWTSWTRSAEKEHQTGAAFLKSLKLATISKTAAAEKASPLFARGAQRLADLKAGQAEASEVTSASNPPLQEQQKSTAGTQNRGATLLDRVLAKQANTANLPAGPTKAQLERKAALHRVVDVAQTLSLVCANKPRASFTMQALIQQLQQSLRTPVGKEEAERVLEVMAREVTPGFVKVLNSGAVKSVVISRAGIVAGHDLRERVAGLLEA
ncbi:hypothetical protein KC315_g10447 [Hortaea werneckii]|nr:hypothetical protein KC315_g10447 [Hortaea werneckii]